MTATETPDAPFGYKDDGTPRKRPANTWMNDPVKRKAAEEKRAATQAAKRNGTAPKKRGTKRPSRPAPAITVDEATDLLARIGVELDEKIADLSAVVAHHTEVVATSTEALNTAEAELIRVSRAREGLNA